MNNSLKLIYNSFDYMDFWRRAINIKSDYYQSQFSALLTEWWWYLYLFKDWVSPDRDLLSCYKNKNSKIVPLKESQLRPSNSTTDNTLSLIENLQYQLNYLAWLLCDSASQKDLWAHPFMCLGFNMNIWKIWQNTT